MAKVKQKVPKESEVQADILDALKRHGFKAIRINSGLARGIYGGIIHLAPNGTFDILLLHPYAWIEVKRPDGKPAVQKLEPDQVEFRSWLDDRHIPNIVVDNAEDAVSFARTLRSIYP